MERKGLERAQSGLSEKEKRGLVQLARSSIEKRLSRRNSSKPEKLEPEPIESAGILKEKRGVFVSLHRRGRLRGCIGCLEGRKPLVQTVEEMAGAAAFQDPRFPPLGPDELQDLDIEISVLTPLREVTDINEIIVGTHGLYIQRGHCGGLLLPQVAVEWDWDRTRFLEETCRKAGLASDCWKEKGTKIYFFSADVFGTPL